MCKSAGQQWFYSQAALEDVQTIEVCRKEPKGRCLGALLHYGDGSREVLGQWRFDFVIDVLAKEDDTQLICFQLDFDGSIPYVQDVHFDFEVIHPGSFTTALDGCLTWWFSELGGYLVHAEV